MLKAVTICDKNDTGRKLMMNKRESPQESDGKMVSIRTKMLAALLSTVGVVLAVIFIAVGLNVASSLTDDSQSMLQKTTNKIVNSVNGWVDTNVAAVKADTNAITYFDLNKKT